MNPLEPWVEDSIYRLIESNLDPNTGQLHGDVVNLPDEDRVHAGSKIRWAAGALDGVLGRQVGDEQQAIGAACGAPNSRAR